MPILAAPPPPPDPDGDALAAALQRFLATKNPAPLYLVAAARPWLTDRTEGR